MSVADVYDGLTVRRPYKESMPHDSAAKFVTNGAGTQFDPRVIAAFQSVAANFDDIRKAWAEPESNQRHSLSAIGTMFESRRKSA